MKTEDHVTVFGGTLESRVDATLQSFNGDVDAISEYLLRAVPLIREYVDDDATTQTTPSTTTQAPGVLDTFVEITGSSSKHTILRKYMIEVDGNMSINDYGTPAPLVQEHIATRRRRDPHGQRIDMADWVCGTCDVAYVLDAASARLGCPMCAISIPYFGDTGLSYNERATVEVISHCAYKRNNHFSEWLNSLQARESTIIPDDVVNAVRTEFKKARATQRSDITPRRVREYLGKLRLNKWYEHTHAICNALGGMPAPRLPAALETKLKSMFAEIQRPFDTWKPIVAPKRKNFLSYSYVLYKFAELLGEDEYLDHFPLLKSKEKLYQMDCIWKKICGDLSWEFIASV